MVAPITASQLDDEVGGIGHAHGGVFSDGLLGGSHRKGLIRDVHPQTLHFGQFAHQFSGKLGIAVVADVLPAPREGSNRIELHAVDEHHLVNVGPLFAFDAEFMEQEGVLRGVIDDLAAEVRMVVERHQALRFFEGKQRAGEAVPVLALGDAVEVALDGVDLENCGAVRHGNLL